MSNRVHQLPPDVANRIAAGEVLERPANAVKELVENALDSGARRISVELEEGGKKLIRVRDDGCGMSASDAVLCLQRHATSKISEAEDLWRIRTLGFRGEALPSIAAVSRLEITTREQDADGGTRVVVDDGVVVSVEEVGCAPGTEIVVRSLFHNTPARFKFLKTDSAEAARVNELLSQLALAYPSVAFTLTHNGNENLRVEAAGDPFNALVSVMGKETARQMLPLSAMEEQDQVRITGFASRPQLTRGNRNQQIFFVNGRVIKSRTLQQALISAYEGLIHGRDRFPLGVIFIQIAPGAVDVNVHPTKSEVRFAREGDVFRAIRSAVKDTLVGAQLAPAWGFATDNVFTGPFGHDAMPPTSETATFQPAPEIPNTPAAPYSFPAAGAPTTSDRERFSQALDQIRRGQRPDDFEPRLFAEPERPKLFLKALAQITNASYILCEGEDGLYIVNQHRAHERILADRAMERAEGRPVESQRLVIPFTVECGSRALTAVEENAPLLRDLGFEVEAFGGNSILVRAVPYLVAQSDYEQAFTDLLDELISGHAGRDLYERRRTLLTMLSCKNAIKAGDPLGQMEMQGLVNDLCELPNPSICPHGQPILIKISTWELHKKFEREYAAR